MRVEQIGDTTLYLGDCLEILPTLDKVDAVVTDPPYEIDETQALALSFHLLSAKGMAYVILDYRMVHQTAIVLSMLLPLRNEIIWKVGWVSGFRVRITDHWVINHNTILQFGQSPGFVLPMRQPRTTKRARYNTPTNPIPFDTVWDDLPSVRQTSFVKIKTGHPFEKPVKLMSRLIKSIGPGGGTILDPFMGSGTTGVACINLGRKFIGIEIESEYFDIACKRIEQAQEQLKLAI